MDVTALGRTGIQVSRLCFGALTIGPLQANLPLEEGAQVVAYAIQQGITFFDTAQLYQSYPYLRRAMEMTGRHDIVIASKTYAYSRELAIQAVEDARRALNRDVIDLFLLHEQESIHTLRGHRGALEYLLEQKSRGVIRAVGASTHRVAGVEGAVREGLDVIHPLLNPQGLGIGDGTVEDMEQAIAEAHQAGMGVYTMKPLGGGNLFRQADRCLQYAFDFPYAHSVAVGMQSIDEVQANLDFYHNRSFSSQAQAVLAEKRRHLHIDDWCEGCGSCVEHCGQRALSIEGDRAVCEHDKCILCGYCAARCPSWAIKVV